MCYIGQSGSTSSSTVAQSSQQSDNSHADRDTIHTSRSCDQSCSIEQSSNPTSVSSSSSVVAVDIVSTPQEDPVQPVNYPFPSTLISNKERCFNLKWYLKYEWLEYSVAKDTVFCHP